VQESFEFDRSSGNRSILQVEVEESLFAPFVHFALPQQESKMPWVNPTRARVEAIISLSLPAAVPLLRWVGEGLRSVTAPRSPVIKV